MEQPEYSITKDDVWSVLDTAHSLLSATATRIFCLGVTGCLFRSLSSPLLHSDFAALLFPGLRALGIDASLVALPNEPQEIAPVLRDLNRSMDCTVFQFGGEPIPDEEEWEVENEAGAQSAQRDRERIVLRQGVLLKVDTEGLLWEDISKQTFTATPEEFRALFSYGIRLRRAAGRETRRVCLLAALQRAVIYQLAFPDLALSHAEVDRKQRIHAAQFLLEAAGRQRDPISLRWRQAAEYLEQEDSEAAWERLYDAALRALNLPPALFNVLESDEEKFLTDVQIRELIYLARAGNRDLKVFAIRRLAREHDNKAIRPTLDQFVLYPDPLVRAASSRRL